MTVDENFFHALDKYRPWLWDTMKKAKEDTSKYTSAIVCFPDEIMHNKDYDTAFVAEIFFRHCGYFVEQCIIEDDPPHWGMILTPDPDKEQLLPRK